MSNKNDIQRLSLVEVQNIQAKNPKYSVHKRNYHKKNNESNTIRARLLFVFSQKEYISTTDDPYLIYTTEGIMDKSSKVSLFSVNFSSDSYIEGHTKIYLDRGDGFSEDCRCWEPAKVVDKNYLVAFIYDLSNVVRIRVDPLVVPGSFKIGTPLISEVENLDEEDISNYLGFAGLVSAMAAGLFDINFYRDTYNLSGTDYEIAQNFASQRHAFRFNPNFAFHSDSYAERNNLELTYEAPIHHYVRIGESMGCSPSDWFDLHWYRKEHLDDMSSNALAHYLKHRGTLSVSPLPEFDPVYYLQIYPDIQEAGRDPAEHFFINGSRENRQPVAWFQTDWYRKTYLNEAENVNPLIHYKHIGKKQGNLPSASSRNSAVHNAIYSNINKSTNFEEIAYHGNIQNPDNIELLAFYLPQFYAFSENNSWWGEGFTEWTNVARGAPRYVGHYQPRIPRDLGFYDLSDVRNTLKQENLARLYGISGFIYYYYWFDGQRLLDVPLNNKLASAEAKLPFALMWANENWTRTWDGGQNEVLINQTYRQENDQELVSDIARYMKDSRYITIDGRPVFFIYRPGIIPNAANTFSRWRNLFRTEHNLDPLIIMVQFGSDFDPRPYGLDGALEFPPHKVARGATDYRSQVDVIDPDFIGAVHKYEEIIEASLKEEMPDYPLIKSVFPSWDNDARRQRRSTSYAGSTPALYERWLRGAIQHAKQKPFFGRTIVGINAWNEWAEGAYLEPDIHYGAAYLNATARALVASNSASKPAPLIVGHDAHHHGAQRLLLHIVEEFVRSFGIKPEIILLGGGGLVSQYSALAPTRVFDDVSRLALHLEAVSVQSKAALLNTTPGARYVKMLAESGFRTVSLVHELPTLISRYGLEGVASDIAQFADHVVFPATSVKTAFEELVEIPVNQALIIPQGLFDKILQDGEKSRKEIIRTLGVPEGRKIVVNAGYADLRKGFDIFLQVARAFEKIDSQVHFIWIGVIEAELGSWLLKEVRGIRPRPNVSLIGFRDDLGDVLSASDVFLLTSREDPFPSVVLDALACGLPIVAMEGTGGFIELFNNDFVGELAPYEDIDCIIKCVQRVISISDDKIKINQQKRIDMIKENFNFKSYCFSLLKLMGHVNSSVSVVIPNYNYEQYLDSRVGSVCEQVYPILELIVLDDCSKDNSVSRLEQIRQETGRFFDIIVNAQNSGNVFKQWKKGIEQSSGDLIWLAEADDMCTPDFLQKIEECFSKDPNMLFAFCDSKAIDENSNHLLDSYQAYQSSMGSPEFSADFIMDAAQFAADHLSIANLILNVSSVVWKRSALLKALSSLGEELFEYRLAGDWRLYLEVCSLGGSVGYVAKPLNIHRRHSGSVTGGLALEYQAREIKKIHDVVLNLFSERLVANRIELMNQYVKSLLNHV